jgi:ApaG protein
MTDAAAPARFTRMAYAAETHAIIVRAEPAFAPEESDPDQGRFMWTYDIEIENRSEEPVQLISRYWRIIDAAGLEQEVRGPGVVGRQPKLNPGESFRYQSRCPLSTPSGMMVGGYQMIRLRTGEPFEIAIPAFALVSPYDAMRAN